MRPWHFVQIVAVILYALQIAQGIRTGSLKGGWRVTALVALSEFALVFSLLLGGGSAA